ncbi:hypothetical protein [Sphingomonas sp.]|uniref:hypothetical protein n=1 Tax=Sphingomonas sp. TaxID=28214 RepID=UPI001B0BC45F|nr:hypothetical protein [Sphingomonas sp.]MBO9711851.1 hypothetical protein [Sphingomonas sp.]
MQRDSRERIGIAVMLALAIGLAIAWSNPVARFKADLRADAKGFAFSLEYAARQLENVRH